MLKGFRQFLLRGNVIDLAVAVVIGGAVGGNVTWLDVPKYPKYRWAYLDGHRVVVDTDTNAVVSIYD